MPPVHPPIVAPILFCGPLDARMPPGAHVQVLLSPTQGYDCYVFAQWIEPGADGLPLHTHDVDQYLYVLAGEMSIQLGSDSFVAGPDTLIHVPPGTPHRSWNAATVDERHLEVLVPAPPFASLSSPAQPRQVSAASSMLQTLASADHHYRDSRIDISRLDLSACEAPDLGTFGQDHMIVMLDGTLALHVDGERNTAVAPCLVTIAPGTTFRASNPGPVSVKCLSVDLSRG